jgi:hypothetical protein
MTHARQEAPENSFRRRGGPAGPQIRHLAGQDQRAIERWPTGAIRHRCWSARRRGAAGTHPTAREFRSSIRYPRGGFRVLMRIPHVYYKNFIPVASWRVLPADKYGTARTFERMAMKIIVVRAVPLISTRTVSRQRRPDSFGAGATEVQHWTKNTNSQLRTKRPTALTEASSQQPAKDGS